MLCAMRSHATPYVPQAQDTRWRLPGWSGPAATMAVSGRTGLYHGAAVPLLLLVSSGNITTSGPVIEVLSCLAHMRHNGAVSMLEQARNEWISYNGDLERMGRAAYRNAYPERSTRPRDPAAAPERVVVDGEEGLYARGFPSEETLNGLRRSGPPTHDTVEEAAAAWQWERMT